MNDIEKTYNRIESEIPSAPELLAIPVSECGEEMVEVKPDGIILSFHNSKGTSDLIGERMTLRKRVLERLLRARDIVDGMREGFALKVFYTYRALSIQEKLYASALEKACKMFPDMPKDWQERYAHTLAARPDVAGHPAGAAVDLTLFDLNSGSDVDMGVPIYRDKYRNAGKRIYTESPEIELGAMRNRMLLRDIMEDAGFAPFSGEFWHFSFGDREWASKLGKNSAFYSQVSVRQVLEWLG